MSQLTVLDIFCGAGGFSEGFRQQGCKIELGVDKWQPAIDTFNFNFGTKSVAIDVLKFARSVEPIEALPDTDVILGSPPCVTFSSSNNSGKANKDSGIELTKAFLRIVAVKRHKPKHRLKAWFMENVSRSTKHLQDSYTFRDLDLVDWAIGRGIGPDSVAIVLDKNRAEINSANYGSPQTRKRTITGEILKQGFVLPEITHSDKPILGLPDFRTVAETIRTLPDPASTPAKDLTVTDPNYPEIQTDAQNLTDHFYDTGLYQCEWELSLYLKRNHPYMGRMSFPEDDQRPSRTVTATKIGSSREAIIYRSGYKRQGDGEYRTATVREAACLMSFPITYQFLGGEGTKWRLVGNAVCPSVSRALAAQVQNALGNPLIRFFQPIHDDLSKVNNLNSYLPKAFNSPPTKHKNSRFRRHLFKDGNITVTLSNYDISTKTQEEPPRWISSVQYGTGEGFPTYVVPNDFHFRQLESIIAKHKSGPAFLNRINNGFSERVAGSRLLQELYESRKSIEPYLEPIELMQHLADIIEALKIDGELFNQSECVAFQEKSAVPMKQLFALYAINKIAHLTAHKESL